MAAGHEQSGAGQIDKPRFRAGCHTARDEYKLQIHNTVSKSGRSGVLMVK